MDRILLLETDRLFWVFFRLSGRVSRAAYFLSSLLLGMIPAFFFYQVMRYPEGSPGSQGWALCFLVTFIASLWSHIALSVKRLHDVDRPGIIAVALFVPIVSIIAFIALCLLAGSLGPNRYGPRTNAPA
jgi:uncharacterized membrane protein YhaH (DUF805 family)